MVGLVLVSHSRQLAEAACTLAKNVIQEELPVSFAGGAGDDHAELGTDATDIMEAIQKVNSGDGVLVLMDLGSAVLSAKLAQQMLEDEIPDIILCSAPLVEGAVAAAVQIGACASVETACKEAKKALAGKQNEIAEEGAASNTRISVADAPVPANATRFRFTMDDPNGMHTRPAAEFVKTLAEFECEVRIRNLLDNGPYVNGRSLNQIALSNIGKGDIAEVAIWGPQAEPALAALKKLVSDVYHGLEVKDIPILPSRHQNGGAGNSSRPAITRLAPGVALGAIVAFESISAPLNPAQVDDPETEVARLEEAVATVRTNLSSQLSSLDPSRGTEAAILEAQLLILDDADILNAVRNRIRKNSLDAASTYQRRMAALADSYRALSSSYLRERAADINGVARQVLDVLDGKPQLDISGVADVVVWAPEVTPALLGRWNREQLKGILTREGGATAHVAILARAMNIPAITGYTPPEGVGTGAKVAMDANRLEVVVDPTAEQLNDFTRRRNAWLDGLKRDLADSMGPATTRDGVRVPVLANVGDAPTVEAAVANHAEGIGLFRTEFLYLDRRLPPDEEEQTRQLARLLRPFAPLPCVVRTLDAGGDKPMPWLDLPLENNPFLGVRGVRLAMAHPELFAIQLRAILRAGGEAGVRDLRIMVPMIATLDEVGYSRDMLEKAHAQLAEEKFAHSWPVRFGVMVETPAAALQAAKLGAVVDFFSLGTNDLTQYVMCAERGSKTLTNLSDAMHPAVLTAIGLVAEGAARHGTEVAVCGEMAGDPVAALALLGLGVHHLSMNASAIGRVKRTLRQVDTKLLSPAIKKALAATTAGEVRTIFEALLPE